MLTGALSIQQVDNGWRLAWQEGSTLHQEVFVDSRVMHRIADLIGIPSTVESAGMMTGYDPKYPGPADAPSPADGD